MEQFFAKRIVEHGKARRANIAETVLAQAGIKRPDAWSNDIDWSSGRYGGYRPVVIDFAIFSDDARYTQEEAHPGEGRAGTPNDTYMYAHEESLFTQSWTGENAPPLETPFCTKSPKFKVRLGRRTVSKHFRELIFRESPALKGNLAYVRLMEYILFGTTIEHSSGRLLLPQVLLATFEDKEHMLPTRNYSGREFLDAFSRDVVKLHYTDWDCERGLARTLLAVDLTRAVREAYRQELEKVWHNEGRVYFDTGKAFNRRSQAEEREANRMDALELLEQASCVEAHELLDYMNHHPPNRFHKMLGHIDAAVLEAFKVKNDDVRSRQMNVLRAIVDQPLPLYKPVGRSLRVFAYNECLLMLKREVRDALCQDWTGFDLRSAQLAIAAKDWNVSEAQSFLATLETGESIWTSLYAHLGMEPNQDAKDVFKPALYAIIFGAGKRKIVEVFEDGGMIEGDAQRFLTHPIIAAMWKARKARLAEIETAGGATDCFGRWIPMPYDNGVPNPRSVLAQLAQARELQLLYPVVELARTTDEFMIMAWLHDGFYVDFKDMSKAARWKKKITDAVNTKAKELGIHTELEPK